MEAEFLTTVKTHILLFSVMIARQYECFRGTSPPSSGYPECNILETHNEAG